MKRIAMLLVFVGACLFTLSGRAAEPTADDYKAFFDHLAGSWSWKFNDVNATFTFKWAGDKCCMIGEGHLTDGTVAGVTFDHYDPKAKAWHRHIVWNNGSIVDEVFVLSSETLKGELKNVEYTSENDAVDPTGAVTHGKNMYRVIDRTHWTVKLSNDILVDMTRK